MVLVFLRIFAPPAKREEILQTVRSLVGPVKADPACLSFHVCQEIENEDALTLIQEWRSQEDLERHVRSNEFNKILAIIEMSSKSPEVKIQTITQTAGIEFLEAVRG